MGVGTRLLTSYQYCKQRPDLINILWQEYNTVWQEIFEGSNLIVKTAKNKINPRNKINCTVHNVRECLHLQTLNSQNGIKRSTIHENWTHENFLLYGKQHLHYHYCYHFVIQHGWTSLMRASSSGYTNIVSVLLEAKADPNITHEVKLHYSHCLYNGNLMHYVTEW